MKKIFKIAIIVTMIIIIVDQLSKFIVEKYYKDGYGNENFGIEIVKNTGMALGFNDGNLKNIFLMSFVIYLLISFLIRQVNQLDTKNTVAVSMALGGGISNLIDRIFKGGVVDFIKIWKFPRFNIADISISIAWVLIVIFLVLYANEKSIIREVENMREKGINKEENERQN